jgi:hypothetical protein
VPYSVLTLRALAALDVSHNDMCEVPPLLGALPHLRDLALGGNPQRLVRQATLERGPPAVLEFLRGRLPRGAEGEAEREYAQRPPAGWGAFAQGQQQQQQQQQQRPNPPPQGLPEWAAAEEAAAARWPAGGGGAPAAAALPPPTAAACLGGGGGAAAPPPQRAPPAARAGWDAAAATAAVDPTSQLHLAEIRRRIAAVAGALQEAEDANVGRGSHKLAAARRDLAMLRAAEARAVGVGAAAGAGGHGV